MASPSDAELRRAYAGRRVLVTGHTGFKGSWLTLWLRELGAEVTGFALEPEGSPAMFDALGLHETCRHLVGDVRDLAALRAAVDGCHPEFVFHLAAQPLVRLSYRCPVETLDTNVMGTAKVLEALRLGGRPCAAVIVTSDKCYENRETLWGYREDEPMGGRDVYSMSKGAAELVVASYRRSFFPAERDASHGVRVASARAGNVVGGGDWAEDRIVPDAVRAITAGRALGVRNPRAVRPWQHVVEPLAGYLLLGARLAGDDGQRYAEGWNLGPALDRTYTVREVVDALVTAWGEGGWQDQSEPGAPHEAALLRLSVEKAAARLGWHPRWGLQATMARTAAWYKAHARGASAAELRALSLRQIDEYLSSPAECERDAH